MRAAKTIFCASSVLLTIIVSQCMANVTSGDLHFSNDASLDPVLSGPFYLELSPVSETLNQKSLQTLSWIIENLISYKMKRTFSNGLGNDFQQMSALQIMNVEYSNDNVKRRINSDNSERNPHRQLTGAAKVNIESPFFFFESHWGDVAEDLPSPLEIQKLIEDTIGDDKLTGTLHLSTDSHLKQLEVVNFDFIITQLPSKSPTRSPSHNPSEIPSSFSTNKPTKLSTKYPTQYPTSSPTRNPTTNPTLYPTGLPTKKPTSGPYLDPSLKPSQQPHSHPTPSPTFTPTKSMIKNPTSSPTRKFNSNTDPLMKATLKPITQPTDIPTETPFSLPSIIPTQKESFTDNDSIEHVLPVNFKNETNNTLKSSFEQIQREQSSGQTTTILSSSAIGFAMIIILFIFLFRRQQQKERIVSLGKRGAGGQSSIQLRTQDSLRKRNSPNVNSIRSALSSPSSSQMDFDGNTYSFRPNTQVLYDVNRNFELHKDMFYSNDPTDELGSGMILYGGSLGDPRRKETIKSTALQPSYFTTTSDMISINSSGENSSSDLNTLEFEPDDTWDPDDSIEEGFFNPHFSETHFPSNTNDKMILLSDSMPTRHNDQMNTSYQMEMIDLEMKDENLIL